MIVLSVIVGINGDKGYISIWGMEMANFRLISHPQGVSKIHIFLFFLVIASHLSMPALLFLTRKKHFLIYLISIPLVYVVCFTLINPFALLFLIPFILMWIIAVIVEIVNPGWSFT